MIIEADDESKTSLRISNSGSTRTHQLWIHMKKKNNQKGKKKREREREFHNDNQIVPNMFQ